MMQHIQSLNRYVEPKQPIFEVVLQAFPTMLLAFDAWLRRCETVCCGCHVCTRSSRVLFGTGWLACLQAKRRVYTLQSGGKAAAGKRKRADNTSSDGTSAGKAAHD